MVQLDEWIEGKKVLILGFGREGQSTCRVLRAFGGYKELAIADQADGKGRCPDKGISWISGPHYQQAMDNYDVVFKSPGIVLERPAEVYSCRILSLPDRITDGDICPHVSPADYRSNRNKGEKYDGYPALPCVKGGREEGHSGGKYRNPGL